MDVISDSSYAGPEELRQPVPEDFPVLTRLLKSISLSSAIIDRLGVIRLTNPAWRNFACHHAHWRLSDCVGVNYVKVASDVSGYSARSCLPEHKWRIPLGDSQTPKHL